MFLRRRRGFTTMQKICESEDLRRRTKSTAAEKRDDGEGANEGEELKNYDKMNETEETDGAVKQTGHEQGIWQLQPPVCCVHEKIGTI
jgi:hypothetical protein